MPQFGQVVAQRQGCLLLKRVGENLGRDEGIAIAVTTDPRSDAQQRSLAVGPTTERRVHHRIQVWNLREQ